MHPPAAVRRVNVNHDLLTLHFRDAQALDAALTHLPPVLANHARTRIDRAQALPQLQLPILSTRDLTSAV